MEDGGGRGLCMTLPQMRRTRGRVLHIVSRNSGQDAREIPAALYFRTRHYHPRLTTPEKCVKRE